MNIKYYLKIVFVNDVMVIRPVFRRINLNENIS